MNKFNNSLVYWLPAVLIFLWIGTFGLKFDQDDIEKRIEKIENNQGDMPIEKLIEWPFTDREGDRAIVIKNYNTKDNILLYYVFEDGKWEIDPYVKAPGIWRDKE